MMRPQGQFDDYGYDPGLRDTRYDGAKGQLRLVRGTDGAGGDVAGRGVRERSGNERDDAEERRMQYRREDIILALFVAALMTFIMFFAESYPR